MMRSVKNPPPGIRWFEHVGACQFCGKPGNGWLRGRSNESYGVACKTCAAKAIERLRKTWA